MTGPTDVRGGGGSGGGRSPVRVPDDIRPGEPVDSGARPPGHAPDRPPGSGGQPPGMRPALRGATRVVAALLVAVSLVHVVMVFLHVAPPNQISRRYAPQIQSWIYPFFEQNWRLFAPEPESAEPEISVRTESRGTDGVRRVSGWTDLTAIDNASVRYSVFPSHTAQNMLRRAWTGYVESHGNSDVSYSERAAMWQEYLRNIAVERVTGGRVGAVENVQLRVLTRSVPGYDASGHTLPVPAAALETRILPWWKAKNA
ncbi:DUF5819 family protein [Streptomyces sp. NBC_01190]|uniref:DUF5819 family protein n=1 Tax=Streptomyces sp. NBC_01190 TaxID=2903767 RepID=UPI00386526AC|nr:DUF5819 family protein [Streptomyces sp. NBC_01190]